MLKRPILRKLFFLLSGFVFPLVSLFSWNVFGAEKLASLYSAQTVSYSLPWFAQDAGLLQKYKLDLDLVYIASSGVATAALLGGDVDIAFAGAVGFVRAFVQGATDIVFIGSSKNILTHSLLAKPDLKRVENLKGKKIGVTRIGGNSHYFAVQALQRVGLDPLRDVTFVQIGGEPEIVAALGKGSIDAGSVTSPSDAVAVSQGFHYLLYGPELAIPYAAASIATRRSTIQKRPEAVAQFMRAMAEASKILHTDRQFAYKVLNKHLGIGGKILDAIYDTEVKIMEPRLDIKPEAIQAILEEVAKIDPRAKKVKAQDLIDRRFVDEMEKSAFFARLWEKP